MIVPQECFIEGLLPLDVEPQLFDRSRGSCEMCGDRPATVICSAGILREFATPADVIHLCKACHVIQHVVVGAAARQRLRQGKAQQQ